MLFDIEFGLQSNNPLSVLLAGRLLNRFQTQLNTHFFAVPLFVKELIYLTIVYIIFLISLKRVIS